MDNLLLELEELGFPMLADWIHDGEIDNLKRALEHLNDNKHMMDNKEDRKAFNRANDIRNRLIPNQK